MSYDPNDYNGHDPECEEREAWEREQEEDYGECLQAFDAGLCSRRTAVSGGAEYLRELAETAMELKEAGGAIPEGVSVTPAPRSSAAPRRERSAA